MPYQGQIGAVDVPHVTFVNPHDIFRDKLENNPTAQLSLA